jgi:hypothetical protein
LYISLLYLHYLHLVFITLFTHAISTTTIITVDYYYKLHNVLLANQNHQN